MDVMEAIAARRSIKRFTDMVVTRDMIEAVLDTAVLAPNHRMTQPWRFYVLGPGSRRRYGEVLGGRKARKVEDAEAAEAVRRKVADENAALPAVIAVAIRQDENPEIREEDYAAAMMAVQNIALAATAMGLGTHIKTGAVMDDAGARAAVGVSAEERIVALVNLGEPAELPAPKPRTDARERTVWVA
jgi:nitroreductase